MKQDVLAAHKVPLVKYLYPAYVSLSFAIIALAHMIFSFDIYAMECRPSEDLNKGSKILGIDYAGVDMDYIKDIQKDELFGALKMSGIWVSKLSVDNYIKVSKRFCRYAEERGQAVFLQIPTAYSNDEISLALESLASIGCKPKGISIGNEVDRLVSEGLAVRYNVSDYISDYNRMVPIVSKHFPSAAIIALELSSFTIKKYSETDPVTTRYRPVFNWLIPFLKGNLVRKPDYLSVHYYPFTGAQKEWETLSGGKMFQDIFRDLESYLTDAPPFIIGEFNATYQFQEETVYPGSGGDSFMSALIMPDILGLGRIAGLFHWSIMEPAPSTLGLYHIQSREPAPLYHSYKMLSSVLDRTTETVETKRANIVGYAYNKGDRYSVIVINKGPCFRRNLLVSGESNSDIFVDGFQGCVGVGSSITLPPFSITQLEGSLSGQGKTDMRRISYADRVVRSGDFSPKERSNAYCSTVADFSEKNYKGEHFNNYKYNQNAKIATGGTYTALSSPGGKIATTDEQGVLTVACTLPLKGYRYNQCGIKLPFVPDWMADRKMGMDLRDGYEKGVFRIKLESEAEVPVELYLEDYQPEAVGNNTHRKIVDIKGLKTIEVQIRDFMQARGVGGIDRDLREVLKNSADLRIEVRQPGFSGKFKVHKVELCDFM